MYIWQQIESASGKSEQSGSLNGEQKYEYERGALHWPQNNERMSTSGRVWPRENGKAHADLNFESTCSVLVTRITRLLYRTDNGKSNLGWLVWLPIPLSLSHKFPPSSLSLFWFGVYAREHTHEMYQIYIIETVRSWLKLHSWLKTNKVKCNLQQH